MIGKTFNKAVPLYSHVDVQNYPFSLWIPYGHKTRSVLPNSGLALEPRHHNSNTLREFNQLWQIKPHTFTTAEPASSDKRVLLDLENPGFTSSRRMAHYQKAQEHPQPRNTDGIQPVDELNSLPVSISLETVPAEEVTDWVSTGNCPSRGSYWLGINWKLSQQRKLLTGYQLETPNMGV